MRQCCDGLCNQGRDCPNSLPLTSKDLIWTWGLILGFTFGPLLVIAAFS